MSFELAGIISTVNALAEKSGSGTLLACTVDFTSTLQKAYDTSENPNWTYGFINLGRQTAQVLNFTFSDSAFNLCEIEAYLCNQKRILNFYIKMRDAGGYIQ